MNNNVGGLLQSYFSGRLNRVVVNSVEKDINCDQGAIISVKMIMPLGAEVNFRNDGAGSIVMDTGTLPAGVWDIVARYRSDGTGYTETDISHPSTVSNNVGLIIVDSPPPGQYYCQAVYVDSNGNRSDWTPEQTINI